jgi:probable FeS assembly SUF system protein SufT
MHTAALSADTSATAIPAGTKVTLPAGTSVRITQTLGGNVTVSTDEGLFRIERADAGAIPGYVPLPDEPAPVVSSGPFREEDVWEVLRTCFDPEIPVNIVDLGLIYDLNVEDAPDGRKNIAVKMTLTAQGCGMGPVIAEDARRKIGALPSIGEAKVFIVWDPVWSPHMISPAGRAKLGLE